MNDGRNEGGQLDLPIWARDKAFPAAGEGYGWLDLKGVRHSCGSLDELCRTIREDKKCSVSLVWTPACGHCQVPEEVPVLSGAIAEVRKEWAVDDLADANHRVKWFGIGLLVLILYVALHGWSQLDGIKRASGLSMSFPQEIKWILGTLVKSTAVGIALLGFLIFAFIPWYQAQKRNREIKNTGQRAEPVIPMIRFETWLDAQRSPVTRAIAVLISLVFLMQVISDKSIWGFYESVLRAGLVKDAYFAGEYWRLLTAPMLHGGILHFAMNALALLYLGKRIEVFARWPHVPAVFVFSALVGGEATARFTETTSVGASGGLMGWLGFLLVFETLHSRLVPRSAKRRLIGGVVLTGLIGLIGYRFIDNAAHFGGLVAGMIYAGIVFPKSSSVLRPKTNLADRLVGIVSMALILFSVVLAALRIFS